MIIKENGKVYNLDPEKGIVTEAATEEVGLEEPEMTENVEPLGVGSQVEAEGKQGQVISKVASVFGDAYGVRFEDGSVDEFGRDNLKASSAPAPVYDTPVDEVKARYAAYVELPAFTAEELEAKDVEARFLNLKAKALIANQDVLYADQRDLDEIIVVTGADILDIKEAKINLDLNGYSDQFNRFSLDNEVMASAPSFGHQGDASWLDQELSEYQEHSDTELAERATEVVGNFSHAELADEEFVRTAASFHVEYMGLGDLAQKKFAGYLELARREQLKRPEQKVAKVEDNFDPETFDTSAFYLSGE
jgi:hypothetical protein